MAASFRQRKQKAANLDRRIVSVQDPENISPDFVPRLRVKVQRPHESVQARAVNLDQVTARLYTVFGNTEQSTRSPSRSPTPPPPTQEEQDLEELREETEAYPALIEAGGRPPYPLHLLVDFFKKPEQYLEHPPYHDIVMFWRGHILCSDERTTFCAGLLSRWETFRRLRHIIRERSVKSEWTLISAADWDTWEAFVERYGPKEGQWGFASYAERMKKRLSKYGFTRQFQLEIDSTRQDTLTTWIEYLGYEYWFYDQDASYVKRFQRRHDEAWNKLVDSGLLRPGETYEVVCHIESVFKRAGEKESAEKAVQSATTAALSAKEAFTTSRDSKSSVPLTAPGLISDSQRNLILQHASSAVFQQNYLSRDVTQDTHAIYRGLDPQTAVMRVASGMTRSIDPRRPRHLSDSQLAEVKRHPEVKLLLRMRNSAAKRIRAKYGTMSRMKGTKIYEKYQQIYRQHQSKKKAVHKALMANVKASYAKRQPLADIESQLNGNLLKPEDKTALEAGSQAHLSEERRRAFAALFTFATAEPAEECQRRTDAINAVTALSRRQDVPVRKACRTRQTYSTGDVKRLDGNGDSAAEPKVDPGPFPIEFLPTQCIFCLGQAELSLERRKKAFRNRDGLKRHFHRKHLRHHPDGEPIDCPHPECDARLYHKAHLQNHAAAVHNTFT